VLTQILVAVPTLLALLALALGRRWSPRTVLTVFAVSLVVPMLVGLLIVSMSGYDLTDTMGTALQATGLVPPMMLFAGLLAVSLLSLGSSFAAGDGPVLPRPARIYLSLGLVLLMLDFAFVVMVAELGAGDESALASIQGALLPLSLVVLGLPYLAYLLILRREAFVGDAPDRVASRSRWPALDRLSSRVLTVAATGVGLLLAIGSIVLAELVAGG